MTVRSPVRKWSGDIPRSNRDDVYQPPARLNEFLGWIERKPEIFPALKQGVLDLAEQFSKERERGR